MFATEIAENKTLILFVFSEHLDNTSEFKLHRIGNSLKRLLNELRPLSSIELRDKLIDLKLVKVFVVFPLVEEIREYCLKDFEAWNAFRIRGKKSDFRLVWSRVMF